MWTFINKCDVDKFKNQHPKLEEYFEDLILIDIKDAYFLPRYISKFFPSQFLHMTNGKKEFKPKKISFKFKGELRDEQKEIVDFLIKLKQSKKTINGVVKARPGLGKTVLSVYLAANFGVRTCIVVDSTQLLEQWIAEIIKFTDLTEKDIGIVQQKMFVVDKPIVIAMVQTLQSNLKNDFEKIFNKIDKAQFDFVVFDEVHKSSSAPQFSKSTLLFRTKNILGLSATPFHFGIHDVLMKTTVGEILFETKVYDLKPQYCMMYYESDIGLNHIKRMNYMRELFQKRAVYNSAISECPNYLNNILKYTKRLLAKDHRIIIVCFTKKQVKAISKILTDNGVTNRRFYGEEKEIDKENDKVIVATYAYAGTGFDMKKLSSLILACPLAGKKSLIQVIGRILRMFKGKQQPVVVDLIDLTVPSFSLPDVKRKKTIISDEFDCDILEVHEK